MQLVKISKTQCFDLLFLWLWMLLGAGLRFLALTSKPPWTDEFATMVFSLGNTYQGVALNQLISPSELLQPLQVNPDANIVDVVSHLLTEDNHPPLYFVLAYWWQRMFSPAGEYVSLLVMRSLSVVFGVLSIPALYFLVKFGFRERSVAHCAALLMAVSPYGVFLAQEARHYTLAILLIIFSCYFLIAAIQHLSHQKTLAFSLVIPWLLINIISLSTHYFLGIILLAQLLVLFANYSKTFSNNHELLSLFSEQ